MPELSLPARGHGTRRRPSSPVPTSARHKAYKSTFSRRRKKHPSRNQSKLSDAASGFCTQGRELLAQAPLWMQRSASDVELPDSFSSRKPGRCVELKEAPEAAATLVTRSSRNFHADGMAQRLRLRAESSGFKVRGAHTLAS